MRLLQTIASSIGLNSQLTTESSGIRYLGHERHWRFLEPLDDEMKAKKVIALVDQIIDEPGKAVRSVRMGFENGHYLVGPGNIARTSIVMKNNEIVSSYPRFYADSRWPLKLDYAHEFYNHVEGILTGTIGRTKISFFDWNYALNKSLYQKGEVFLFSLSILAYSLEVNSSSKHRFSEDFTGFFPTSAEQGGLKDEIICVTHILDVSNLLYAGISFQVCRVALMQNGMSLTTRLFVPSTIYEKTLKLGDKVYFTGWLSGRVVG